MSELDTIFLDLRKHLLCLPCDADSNQYNSNLDASMFGGLVMQGLVDFAKLRATNIQPADLPRSAEMRGVVVEFGVASGIDAFAAYSDGWIGWYDSSSRKFYEGSALGDLKNLIASLLASAERIVGEPADAIAGQPPMPAPGECTISVVTPVGIFYGLGASRAMAADQFGAPIIREALRLRKFLLESL